MLMGTSRVLVWALVRDVLRLFIAALIDMRSNSLLRFFFIWANLCLTLILIIHIFLNRLHVGKLSLRISIRVRLNLYEALLHVLLHWSFGGTQRIQSFLHIYDNIGHRTPSLWLVGHHYFDVGHESFATRLGSWPLCACHWLDGFLFINLISNVDRRVLKRLTLFFCL